ncbi:MAG: hypothetical protein NTX50_01020 [Candidatus Sumerlaeota bacterium]|nr:hypothetical protein [Candidatus Sumerlaeota bacterium]
MQMLRAYVIDETHLELMSPIEASSGSEAFVSVANADEISQERMEQLTMSMQSLERGYGDSEPEYLASQIIAPNPK